MSKDINTWEEGNFSDEFGEFQLYTKDYYGQYRWWMSEKRFRLGAFGAIRRAAEVARIYDRAGDKHDDAGALEDANLAWHAADSIRDAIRAAIGSEKT